MPFRRWFGYHGRPVALDPMSCDYVPLGDGMSKINQGMRLTREVPIVYGISARTKPRATLRPPLSR